MDNKIWWIFGPDKHLGMDSAISNCSRNGNGNHHEGRLSRRDSSHLRSALLPTEPS